MARPRIFLSSTIRDLADLRSAAKYWLEENGFEVYASEWPDFPHSLDTATVEASLAPISDCDYYALLVGWRAGHLVADTGISVTRMEFRRARTLRRLTGQPKMLHLARADVLEARSIGRPSEIAEEDWEHVRDLLTEVQTEEQPGDPNWIRAFSSFRDVVDALRATLRVSGPLRRRALEANLLRETLENATELLLRSPEGQVAPKSRWLATDHVPIPMFGADDVTVGYPGTRLIVEFYFGLPRMATLTGHALDEAIASGEFLMYDSGTGAFVVGALQQALLDLRHEMLRVDGLTESIKSSEQITSDFNRLVDASRLRRETRVSTFTLLHLYSARNALWNVLALSRFIYKALADPSANHQSPTLLPPNPRGDTDSPREDANREEAERWLLSDS